MLNPRLLPTTLALIVIGLVGCAADESTDWETSYARVRQSAKSTDKPILLSIGSPSCSWCAKLHSTTFRDEDVVGLLNKSYVTGKIDGSRNQELVKQLRVKAYPTIVIAAPDGTVLHVSQGYQTAEEMTRTLQRGLSLVQAHQRKKRDS